jgi:hypothetical protein
MRPGRGVSEADGWLQKFFYEIVYIDDMLSARHRFIRLGLLQAIIYFFASLPFLAAGALTYFGLLAEHDINYYLTERSWQLWVALLIALVIAGGCLLLGAWLYIRWLFAVPALIFENANPLIFNSFLAG